MLGVSKRFADYATKSVAGDCIADDFRADRQTESRPVGIVAAYHDRKTIVAESAPLSVSRFEICFTEYPARSREPETVVSGVRNVPNQGISFLRPLARRRARILRPFAVAIRARKPCVRARRTLLG